MCIYYAISKFRLQPNPKMMRVVEKVGHFVWHDLKIEERKEELPG